MREREILGELTDALAGLIAEETGARPGQVEPWLAAHAVLGLYASLLELARDRVLAGVTGPELSAELRRQGRRGLALLQFGLAGYAKRGDRPRRAGGHRGQSRPASGLERAGPETPAVAVDGSARQITGSCSAAAAGRRGRRGRRGSG